MWAAPSRRGTDVAPLPVMDPQRTRIDEPEPTGRKASPWTRLETPRPPSARTPYRACLAPKTTSSSRNTVRISATSI